MKELRKNFTFAALCLAVGLVVFGVSYTLMGQGPGGDTDSGGAVGGVDDGEKGKKPTPGVPDEMLPGDEEPGPVGQVNELFDVIVGGDVPALKHLLEDGADPNAINEDGVTALQWTVLGMPTTATVYGQVQALLDAGANPNIPDGRGRTALHYAAEHGGSNAVTQALIDGGGSVNTQDQTGLTALQLAAMLGNTGAQSAIEQATTVRPPDYEKLNALGNFSQRLRAATTEEGKKEILKREATSMVKRGWMTEEEQKALLQAIENLGD